MKSLKESILDNNFDIRGVDTNFKGCDELIDLFGSCGWKLYYENKDAKVYLSDTKISLSDVDDLLRKIKTSSGATVQHLVVSITTALREYTTRIAYEDGNTLKYCAINMRRQGDLMVSFGETTMSYEKDKFTRGARYKVPTAVIDVLKAIITGTV